MKKVGIITYHNTTNYGALLQAFALQSKLTELGSNCEIINYHCDNIEKREHVVFPKFQINILRYMLEVRVYLKVLQKRKKMNSFVKKYMHISKTEYTRNTIKDSNSSYDKFVVGSDMVFAPHINDGDMTFYLDFADSKKRYSYAASLGIDKIDEKYFDLCRNELEKFQYISIREKQGQDYFSKILKSEVYNDIDPTFLYDGKFWKKYEEIPKIVPTKKYILLYFLNKNMPEFELAKKIAKENDYDIYILTNGKIKIHDCKVIYNASVGEFLYYIHNAALVITASFHGMAFSINYNTNFMYFSHINSSSRLDNVADITNTHDRKITNNYIPKIKCNFEKINKAISIEREKSIEHIKNFILNEEDNKNGK